MSIPGQSAGRHHHAERATVKGARAV